MPSLADAFAALSVAGQRLGMLVPCVVGPQIGPDLPEALAGCEGGGAGMVVVIFPSREGYWASTEVARAARTGSGSTAEALGWVGNARQRVRVPIVALVPIGGLVDLSGEVGRLGEGVGRLRDAGVDALLVPDAPLEELAGVRERCAAVGMSCVLTIPSRCAPGRAAAIRAASTGGVLAGLDVPAGEAGAPVLRGGGVRTPQQVASALKQGEGVMVASVLVGVVEEAARLRRDVGIAIKNAVQTLSQGLYL